VRIDCEPSGNVQISTSESLTVGGKTERLVAAGGGGKSVKETSGKLNKKIFPLRMAAQEDLLKVSW